MADGFPPPDVHNLAVAAMGAVSGVLVARKSRLKDIFGLLTVGTFTGLNCGPGLAEKFGTPLDLTIYLTGVAGWVGLLVVIAMVKSKMPEHHQKAKE